jgi:enamine deaminase RidA (YjgF/YER057c/UK114 family)
MSAISDWFARQALKPTRYGSGGPYEEIWGYSRVVRAGDLAWTAGTTAVVDGELQGVGDAAQQTTIALEQAVAALERAGVRREYIVQSRLYVVDVETHGDAVGRAHAGVLGDLKPVAALIGVTGLADPRMIVEVELVASPGRRMRGGR